MSIASKMNTVRADQQRLADKFLYEPEAAEMDVARICGQQISATPALPVVAFASVLLNIRQGIQSGEISKTLATIDLLVELAYLHTEDYLSGLARFRECLKEGAGANDSTRDADDSGGEWLSITLSQALRDALQTDAERDRREPHLQVVAILEYHFGLYEPTPGAPMDADTAPKIEPRKEGKEDESQG